MRILKTRAMVIVLVIPMVKIEIFHLTVITPLQSQFPHPAITQN